MKDILAANNITTLKGIVKLRKNSIESKVIYRLIRNGYKVPYFSRPICKYCGFHFIPTLPQQFTCNECRGVSSPYIELSPEDCKELGLDFDTANEYLHLPEYYREWYKNIE